MKKIFVDGNSIGYANHCGVRLTSGGFEVQAIFGFIKSMRNLKIRNQGGSETVFWDGHPQWKYDLFPGYKADRDKDPKQALMRANYKKARPFIELAFKHLGVRQVTYKSGEADDMAGYFTQNISEGTEIELVSGDEDWIQLVSPNVFWHDPIRDKTVTNNSIFDFSGYQNGRAFLEGKALQGDTSDKISGVGGIGEGKAPLFIAKFGSVQGFFDAVDNGSYKPKGKIEERFADINLEGRKLFERNMKLMNLIDAPKPKAEDVIYTPPKFDKDKFRGICEQFAFASILVNFDNFVKPFEEVK